jgi:hypothetical protein
MRNQRINIVIFIGLLLLAATKLPGPKMANLDFLSDALWTGCKVQAMKHLGFS